MAELGDEVIDRSTHRLTGVYIDDGHDFDRAPVAVFGTGRIWGPVADHTLSAMVNDLHVCERPARQFLSRSVAAACGNALPRFTGGQVVETTPSSEQSTKPLAEQIRHASL
jgi:hypothetical protein